MPADALLLVFSALFVRGGRFWPEGRQFRKKSLFFPRKYEDKINVSFLSAYISSLYLT
jgi:hypothetical protein